MVNSINVPANVETDIVEGAAILTAAGSAGLVLASYLPPSPLQTTVATVAGALITAGAAILAIWHKFINVVQNPPQQ